MSSIIMRAGIVLAGSLLLLSVGCSKERMSGSGVLINPDTGKHAAQWGAPDVHGADAKGAASSTTGFAVCQECHNTDFSGGISKTTCLNTAGCHGANVSAPHSPRPWMGTRTHTNTDPSNAPVCAKCHTNGANCSVKPSPFDPAAAPGCFNNTLCHGVVGHPAGWALPTAHGAAAKSAPSPSGGFSLCQSCHGNDFTGGNALKSCLNTAGCHGANISAPHAGAWLPGNTYTHVTTDQGNALVCALCHANGLNSPIAPPSPPAPAGTPPGCFNNTLCHATPSCGTCHGIPPDGTAFPNVAGQHAPHKAVNPTIVVCGTCHMGAGSGTALHQNGVVDVILDPTFNAKSGAAAYNPASVSCSNISCHGGSRTQSVTQAGQKPPLSTVTQTPSWLAGTINVDTDCTVCHVLGSALGTPENNSYYSGRHYLHVYDPNNGPQPKLSCTACHDPSLLATNHLTTLNTPAMEGPASATIWSFITYSGGTCFSSTSVCHGSHTW